MRYNTQKWPHRIGHFLFCTFLFIFSSSSSAKLTQEIYPPQWTEPSFETAFIQYIENPQEMEEQPGITGYLSEIARADLKALIDIFGKTRINQSFQIFPANRLHTVLETHGEDFFLMVLDQTVRSVDYLQLLDKTFDLDQDALLATTLHSKSRYTGGLMVLQEIEPPHFNAVIQAFAQALPPEVFIDSFYEDPYLLASAVRIIAERDPSGSNLNEFLKLVPRNHNVSDLFTNDLPGLVVAFSTIQEISHGSKISWATQTLSITQEHLSRLILQKPANLAYILYGSHRIGIKNFKKIINGLGGDRFATVLDNHSGWLANFLAGLNKITSLSTAANFEEIKQAEAHLAESYPYLLQHDSYLWPNREKVKQIFNELPSTSQFLNSKDLATRTRIYLLSLVTVYQGILHEQLPESTLTPLQFDLLKQQIIYSTRFSDHLNNMLSNFEVGRSMIKDVHMETVILLLAHELAHQIYSISGFDAPLLSAATIHECSADIGARAVGEKLQYHIGIQEYSDRFVLADDYSSDSTIEESDLLRHHDPHKIGRTQLGYIIQAMKNSGISPNWGSLFSVNLSVLKDKIKMKHLSFIRDVIGGYVYMGSTIDKSHAQLNTFLNSYTSVYDTTQRGRSKQIAAVGIVEEMIAIARSMVLQAAIHIPNEG